MLMILAFMICMGMFGNGARTGMVAIQQVLLQTQEVHPAAITECPVAAVGAMTLRTAVPLAVTATRPVFGPITSDFAS